MLEHTVVDPLTDRPPLPALTIAPPPRPDKPTQANPRAYKGTKDRPPKPRRPEAVDLRPFLCVPGAQDRVLQVVRDELGDFEVCDDERDVPVGFGRSFAWLAKREPALWSHAKATHHRLGLERDATLRRALLYHFAERDDPREHHWIRALEALSVPRRLRFLEALFAAPLSMARAPCDASLRELDVMSDADSFASRADYCAEALARGFEMARCLPAVELAERHAPNYDFGRLAEPETLPSADDARRILDFSEAAYPEPEDSPMALWSAASLDEDFCRVLDLLIEHDLDADTQRKIATHVAYEFLHWDAPERFAPHLPEIARSIEAIASTQAAYRERATRTFLEYVDEDCYENLEGAARFMRRVCREPFDAGGHAHVALQQFTRLDENGIDRMLAAPDRSYEVLLDATRRKNDAWIVTYGLSSMLKVNELFLSTFEANPRRMMRVASTLGALSDPLRNRIVIEVAKHSALDVDVDTRDAFELAELYDKHRPNRGTSPIPKKLRAHMRGELALSDAQIARIQQKIRDAWPAVLLDLIEERVGLELQKSLGAHELDVEELGDRMLHALRLLQDLDANQRSLRRLLRACMRGDRDGVREHPANARWLEEQPERVQQRWLSELVLERELEDGARVKLSIEHDPLEVIRLGSYVGSCLGLGGTYTYSAAAIAIDINKQVVFARDANGHFLARQVLALTKDGKLACYAIYPKASRALRGAFAEFDAMLAKDLQLEIDSSSHDNEDREIELIVAEKWWDDGLWDFALSS